MKNELMLLILISLASAYYLPQSLGASPPPIQNQSSGLFCQLISNDTGTWNATAYLQYSNGTNIANFSQIINSNASVSIFSYNFNDTPLGSVITVNCTFNSTYSALSTAQTVGGGFYGSTSPDFQEMGILVGLAVLVAIFAYLSVQALNPIWSQLWAFIANILIIINCMAIIGFSELEAANGITLVGVALMVAFIGFFMFELGLFFVYFFKIVVKGILDARNENRW